MFRIDNELDIWYNYTVDGIHGLTVIKDGKTTEYVFRRNFQGDVTHIYKLNADKTLSLAARYKYDAWGNCEVEEIDGSGIGAVNPIRYRSYYFDTETGLYYLNARYYDPETGRFISADDTKFLNPDAINGLNLFAYCGNNPVMRMDANGRSSLSIGFETDSLFSYKGHVWQFGRNRNRLFQSNNLLNCFLSHLEARAISWSVDIIKGADWGVKVFDISLDLFEFRIYGTITDDSSYASIKIGSVSAGLGFEANNFGIEASATALSIGAYSKYIDAEFLIGSIGFTLKYKNGVLKIGASFIFGFELTIRIT